MGPMIGGILGAIFGVVFICLSMQSRPNGVTPPGFLVFLFAFVGYAIGKVLSEGWKEHKEKEKNANQKEN